MENKNHTQWPPRRKIRAEFANSGMVTGSMYRSDLELNKNIEWVEYLSVQEHEAIVEELNKKVSRMQEHINALEDVLVENGLE